MMPNTRVNPAAIRNSITPSWSPLSVCSRTSTKFMHQRAMPRDERRRASVPSRGGKPARVAGLPSLHRAFLVKRVFVVGEDGLLDFHYRILAGRPCDRFQQIEVLDREVVRVVGKLAAGGGEIRLLHRGDHPFLVREI